MNLYLIILIISLIVLLIIITRFILYKKEISSILEQLEFILNNDTNSLIRQKYSFKNLKVLVNVLNNELKELIKERNKYKFNNNELNKTITNMTHDLRTPLTAINGYLDLYEEKPDKKYLKIMKKKCNELSKLTESLFQFSKTNEKYFVDYKKEKICLNDFLEEKLISYYELFHNKKIEPNINITDQKIYININYEMLDSIFENIISNIIKYANKIFKVVLTDNGTLTFKNDANNLDKISVSKIFDRYYTVNTSKKSSGIGLSMAKEFVELNNGTIDAYYNNNKLTITINFKQRK